MRPFRVCCKIRLSQPAFRSEWGSLDEAASSSEEDALFQRFSKR
ncbi:hypothetical protein RchiOBHm_Chr4g0386791 [Rosa chinensis]|uniref:Uncharacterized protein n=1 Tax=Rosa chinensis TaxID=74649 RepID=A0A2P6QPA5_ROSCH|nr:hypothetical protein RchiOBHm_Chr4g0386791 [Rosa chinensis]